MSRVLLRASYVVAGASLLWFGYGLWMHDTDAIMSANILLTLSMFGIWAGESWQ